VTGIDFSSTPASPSSAGRSPTFLPTLGLLGVTAVWGSTFFMIADIVHRIDVPDLLAVRFTLAAVVLAVIGWRSMRRLSPLARRRGVLLGLLYGVAQFLQTYGLAHTSPALSGFLTGMYVVLTPILGAVLVRTAITRSVAVAVLLAAGGLAVLSVHGSGGGFGLGEMLTLGSALIYAIHIVALGRWSDPAEVFGLSAVQMIVIAGVSLLAALPGGIALPANRRDWLVVLYLALFAGALALIAQTWAQAHLPPTRAAITMCAEPVWAATFAVAFASQPVTWRLLVGGGLIVTAMGVADVSGTGSPVVAALPGELPR
jgi:drug/metabolite transporter (DMT)-like permease